MLGAGVGRVLVASSGLGRLALELPAARSSGWLWNEASADRGPVTAWLERGEQHLHQECPSWRSHTFTRRTPMTMIIGIDPHKGDAHGGRDRRRRTAGRTVRGASGPRPGAA